MDNSEWLAALRSRGAPRDRALADLRTLLVSGLKKGLPGWAASIGPEFDALAEDFAQDALLKILDKLDTFRGESQFTTWAHKIAIRVALSELRRKRWQDVSLDALMETRGNAAKPGASMRGGEASIATGATTGTSRTMPNPATEAEQADLLEKVERIIKTELTPRQRIAMMAVGMRGMPLEEVARRMGTNRNALYKLLHDARIRLKQRLAREELTPSDILASFEGG